MSKIVKGDVLVCTQLGKLGLGDDIKTIIPLTLYLIESLLMHGVLTSNGIDSTKLTYIPYEFIEDAAEYSKDLKFRGMQAPHFKKFDEENDNY